jgi:Protein of unknown function (DUF2911)
VSSQFSRRSLFWTAFAASALSAQLERAKAAIDLDGRKISIDYDPVPLNGKQYGKTLAPFGRVWRLGSEAPVIAVNAYTLTVMFELLPGAYRLFVIPHPDKWTLIPSTATSGNVYEPSKDVGRFDVPVKPLSEPVQQLTIALARQASNVARLSISIGRALVSTDLKML